MAGNSRRRGAIRKAGTKKGPTVGSGGVRRRGLEGRGATPPAHMRPGHPAARRAVKQTQTRRQTKPTDETEMVLGRNPVVECLRADAPATALYVALGAEADERLTESVTLAADRGISLGSQDVLLVSAAAQISALPAQLMFSASSVVF